MPHPNGFASHYANNFWPALPVGKHNDLEDARLDINYHTFFETLGRSACGDCFKRQAIDRAEQPLVQV